MSKRLAICLKCDKKFKPLPNSKGKYCSKECWTSSGKLRNTGKTRFQKGMKSWNKGQGIYKNCIICNKKFYVWLAHSDRVKCCSKKCGYKFRKSYKGMNNPMWGKKGKLSPVWKGGITPRRNQIYNHSLTKEWRTKVFQRDCYTCQICGQVGGKLQVDHIKPWKFFPRLRFKISNGRTLCFKCHLNTETFGRKVFSYASS